MIDAPSPAPLFTPPPPPTRFQRLWRGVLPTGLAIVAVALLLGVFDTSARPAWLFVVGAVVTALGVASLALHLTRKSRAGLAALEAEIEERFGEEKK